MLRFLGTVVVVYIFIGWFIYGLLALTDETVVNRQKSTYWNVVVAIFFVVGWLPALFYNKKHGPPDE